MSTEAKVRYLEHKLQKIEQLVDYVISISYEDKMSNVTVQEKYLSKQILAIINGIQE